MPETEQFVSANGKFRLTVTPAEIGSQLKYFQEEVDKHQGKSVPDRGTALARLEQKTGQGDWETVWIAPLRNRVAPVDALVSNDGACVVTFDDWHGVGTGPNVVALYDKSGSHVRSMTLTDLVGAEYAEALPASVSSIRWSGNRRFSDDSKNLLLQVLVPSEGSNDPATYVDFVIDLKDASVRRPNETEWNSALARARAVNAAAGAAEQQRIRYLSEPLRFPEIKTERALHEYLGEAFYRLTPDYLDSPSTATKVLRARAAADYEVSEQWVIEAFADEKEFNFGGGIALATLGEEADLIAVLRKAAAKVGRGSLKGAPIYVAVSASNRDAAQAAIAPTGAHFVWLDPVTAIPQRPERMPGSATAKAAEDERMRRESETLESALKEIQSRN